MAYTTLTELRTYLEVDEHGDDTLLESCIDRAQQVIDTYTNRVFAAPPDGIRHYRRDAVDGRWLWLGADLAELDAIINGDEAATAIDPADVRLYPRDDGPPYHRIRLLRNADTGWIVEGDNEITVWGWWGYSRTPPADIVQATLRLSAYLYRQRDAGSWDTVAVHEGGTIMVPQGLPVTVKQTLDSYVRHSL